MTFTGVLFILVLSLLCLTIFNIVGWPRVRRAAPESPNKVSILIPARNEEEHLAACLEAALLQGEIVREILVYNDHSTDGTARVLGEFALREGRVRPLDPAPLAPGWCGKNFACDQLAKAADSHWLLFIDADARLTEGAAARMVNEMDRRRLTFLSCWPGLEMESFWERALMPMLNFVVFSIFPAPLSLFLNFPSLALAHGACLMFERKRYFEIGGHAAVRDQIFEDTRLARLWRAEGARGLCLDGQDLVRVRMYASFEQIRRGFEKNFFPAFQHEINFWLFLAFHLVFYFAPFAVLSVAPSRAMIATASAILLTRLALALYFRHPLRTILFHPIAEAILIGIGLSSWRRCKSGRGVDWKGREYFRSAP